MTFQIFLTIVLMLVSVFVAVVMGKRNIEPKIALPVIILCSVIAVLLSQVIFQ